MGVTVAKRGSLWVSGVGRSIVTVGVSQTKWGVIGAQWEQVKVTGGQCAMYIYPKICPLLPVICACLPSSKKRLIQ